MFFESEDTEDFFNQVTMLKSSDLQDSDVLFTYFVNLDPEVDIIQFRNDKILDVFSQIGGIVKFFGYFIFIVHKFYKKILINNLVYEINDFDQNINHTNTHINNNTSNFNNDFINTQQDTTLENNTKEILLSNNEKQSINYINEDFNKESLNSNNSNNYTNLK